MDRWSAPWLTLFVMVLGAAVGSAVPATAARVAKKPNPAESLPCANVVQWSNAAAMPGYSDDIGATGRFGVGFANGRSDTLVVALDEPGVVSLSWRDAGVAAFVMPEGVFTYGFCRCAEFRGLERDDRITIAGLDPGHVARSLGIGYVHLSDALPVTHARQQAIGRIEDLTGAGARGVEVGSLARDHADGAGWAVAARNSVAVVVHGSAYARRRNGAIVRADDRRAVIVGGGTIVRVRERLVVVTAAHVVPPMDRRGGISVVTVDGQNYSMRLILHGGRRYDVAILTFGDQDIEHDVAARFSGVTLAPSQVAAGDFGFHIGFPKTWQDPAAARREGRRPAFATAAEPDATMSRDLSAPMVLNSGVVSVSRPTFVHLSARIGHGDSGGGLFVLDDKGSPLLVGPASTVRIREGDGNPPQSTPLGPVIGRYLALHAFDVGKILMRQSTR